MKRFERRPQKVQELLRTDVTARARVGGEVPTSFDMSAPRHLKGPMGSPRILRLCEEEGGRPCTSGAPEQ